MVMVSDKIEEETKTGVIKIIGTVKTLILETLSGEGPGHIREIHLRVSRLQLTLMIWYCLLV